MTSITPIEKSIHKYPRLYVAKTLGENINLELPIAQTHYLKNVLRKTTGDHIRVFNGVNGEWLYKITALCKKNTAAAPTQKLKDQPAQTLHKHLIFAPIKKSRMDFLIEKSVELGVTGLHPVIMDHSETRNVKIDRTNAQIIEAAEQCERLDLPVLHPITPLYKAIEKWPKKIKILWAAERTDSTHISKINTPCNTAITFLIGPEGGFSDNEIKFLSQTQNINAISLGEKILRAETAAIACLSRFL